MSLKRVGSCLTNFGVVVLMLGSSIAWGATLKYAVALHVNGDKVDSLSAILTLRATAGSIRRFELPEGDSFDRVRTRREVKGGTLLPELSGASLFAVRATGPRLEILYRIPFDLKFGSGPNDQASSVSPSKFSVHTADVLIAPLVCAQCSSTITLVGLPEKWTAMYGPRTPEPLTYLRDSMIVGGSDYHLIQRDVDGVPTRLLYPDSLGMNAEAILSSGAEIIHAERHFWHAEARQFDIALIENEDDEGFSGTGFRDGLALYLGTKVKRDDWVRLIAHECSHNWISRRIGGFPISVPDVEAWLNEGFTEAFTARILLESGLWALDQFIADWNTALMRYDTSPVKNAPNSRIVADRQRDFDVNRLPYDRGRLLALYWDKLFRSRTRGRFGLTDVLLNQEGQAGRNRLRHTTVSADVLFPSIVRTLTGVDLSSDIEEYVVRGKDFALPPDAFGPCAEVLPHTQAEFDRGFDLEKTMRAHEIVQDLEAGGPADRAGLLAGDRLQIDEVPTHDSRVILRYKVKTGDRPWRSVSYAPAGSRSVTFDQISLVPIGLSPKECQASMLRP